MNKNFLQELYENAILPQYQIDISDVKWKSHEKVSLDAYAHYFNCENKEYVLLWEDFPDGKPFSDGLSHQIVMLGNETCLNISINPLKKHIENITGYFTLFVEHS